VDLSGVADVSNNTQPAPVCRLLPYNSRVARTSRGYMPP